MIVIIYLLAIFFVAFVITVAFVLFNLTKENKELQAKNDELTKSLTDTKSENAELQVKVDDFMKNSTIGITYSTDDPNIQKIADNLKAIFQEIQIASCSSIRSQFLLNRQEFIDSISATLRNNPVKCSEIKAIYNTQTTEFANNISANIVTAVPTANVDKLKTQFKTMIENVLVAVCSGDNLDVTKIDKFLMDVIDAIC